MVKKLQIFLILSIFAMQMISAMEHEQQLTPEIVKQIAKTVIQEQQKKDAPGISAWIPSKNFLFWSAVAITGGLIIRNRWWASPADLRKANQEANVYFQNKLGASDQDSQQNMQILQENIVENTKQVGIVQEGINYIKGSLNGLKNQSTTFIKLLDDQLTDEEKRQRILLEEFAQEQSTLLAQQKKGVQDFGENVQASLKLVGDGIEAQNDNVQKNLGQNTKHLLKLIASSMNKRDNFVNLNGGLTTLWNSQQQIVSKINGAQNGLQKTSDSLRVIQAQLHTESDAKDTLMKKIAEQTQQSTFSEDYTETSQGLSVLTQNLSGLSDLIDSQQ
jgi:hypothetical protein